MPILQIAVSGDLPLRDLTEIADEQIKERLESVSGVGQVQLVGGADREIQIRLDPDVMRSFNVTLSEVAAALRQQNVELPAGRIPLGPQELTVRTMGKITDPREFRAVPVADRAGYVVRLGDIAEVVDDQEELRSASFLNGKSAVTLVVQKQSGQNTVTVAEEVKARLASLAATLPPGVSTAINNDQSLFILAAISSLEEHLVLGSILASIVVFFFLANWRTTLIAAVAIPTSIVSTFALIAAMGYTLNQLTMLGLTLMVGVVIDDAIIVLENIYRFIEEKGMAPFDAAIEGTREIGLAVMATTLSLMAVFVPVGFMGGMVGRFMSSFGLTAAFAVGVSLLVSFTLTPMLSSRFIKVRHDRRRGHEHGSKDSLFFRPIDRSYMAMLRWSMAHRWVVVVICALVIGSIVPLFQAIGKSFVPTDDRSEFQVAVRAAEGSGLAATTTILERIAADLREFPEVARYADDGRRERRQRHGGDDGRRRPAERERGLDLRDAPFAGRTRGVAGRGDDPRARSAAPVSERAADEHPGVGRRRRRDGRPVHDLGPGSQTPGGVLRRPASAGPGTSRRGRRRYVAGDRTAGAARRNRPAARGRPGRQGAGHRAGVLHAGRRQQDDELLRRRRTVRRHDSREPALSDRIPRAWRA